MGVGKPGKMGVGKPGKPFVPSSVNNKRAVASPNSDGEV
jgi:hypothetical protein